MEGVWAVLRELVVSESAQFVGITLAAIAGYFAGAIKNFLVGISVYFSRLRRARLSVQRVRGPSGLREGDGVWVTKPIVAPANYRTRIAASRILNVANLKGGVGKTTIAANLGTAMAATGRRVLLIDLDFQGSLSAMARRENWLPPEGQDSLASKLISGDISADMLAQTMKPVDRWEEYRRGAALRSGTLDLVGAYYDLARAENRIMIEWLLGGSREDPRYTLADVLHAPAVLDAYDVVILDSPPRLTTASVQALCASSHILIPTILDRASATAVRTLVDQTQILADRGIAPHLRHLGVVGSMSLATVGYQEEGREEVRRHLYGQDVPVFDRDFDVPRVATFPNALDKGIAYLVFTTAEGRDIRATFDRLAQELLERMNR